MSAVQSENDVISSPQLDTTALKVQIGSVMLLSMGVMMLAFGAAYIKDLETLRSVPGAIWSAVCGKPSENGIAVPLLLTIGVLFLLSAGGLQAWGRYFRTNL
jgi:hypothetical protein